MIEGVDDRANMVETQKTFALLGELSGTPLQQMEKSVCLFF